MLFITYNLQDQWSTPKPLGPKAFRHFSLFLLYRLLQTCMTTFSLEPQGFSAFLASFCQTNPSKSVWQPFPLSPKAFRHFWPPFVRQTLQRVSDNLFPWAPKLSGIFLPFFVRQAALQPFPLGPRVFRHSQCLLCNAKTLIVYMTFIAYSLQDPLPKANPLRVKGFPPFFASLFAK